MTNTLSVWGIQKMRRLGGTQKAADLVWRLVVACFVFYVFCQLFGLLGAGAIFVLKPVVAAVSPAFRELLVFGTIGILVVGVPTLLVFALAWLNKRYGDDRHDEPQSEAAPTSDRT